MQTRAEKPSRNVPASNFSRKKLLIAMVSGSAFHPREVLAREAERLAERQEPLGVARRALEVAALLAE